MQSTDLRVVKTMKQIDQALLSCLSDTPFDKITVEQLCQAALINRSTFYKYYTSKYDLMDRYLERALEGFWRQVDVAFVNASPETIHDLLYQKSFENTLKYLAKHKAEYLLLWSIPQETSVFILSHIPRICIGGRGRCVFSGRCASGNERVFNDEKDVCIVSCLCHDAALCLRRRGKQFHSGGEFGLRKPGDPV